MRKHLTLSGFAFLILVVCYFAVAKSQVCFAAAQSCQAPMTPAHEAQSSSAKFQLYSPEKLADLLANNQIVVLFFQASWCANCAETEAGIRQQLQQLPENVVILSVNYDMNGKLAAKYGVTHQDMFVLLNPDASAKKVWASQNHNIDQILNSVK